MIFVKSFVFLAILGTLTACMSTYMKNIAGESSQTYERNYFSDFNTVWQAVLETLKNNQMDVTNREGGYVQTKWIDNTAEKNFTVALGTAGDYLKAQYRFRIWATKGFFNGHPAIKVSVQKEQLVQRDALETWRTIATDSIDEMTLLYRIGRIILIRNKIQKEQEEKIKKEFQQK